MFICPSVLVRNADPVHILIHFEETIHSDTYCNISAMYRNIHFSRTATQHGIGSVAVCL